MKTKLILFITTVFLLSGCGEKKCPGFPDEYADYLPYSIGQILKYSNTNKDTISFEITDLFQTKETMDDYNAFCANPSISFTATAFSDNFAIEYFSGGVVIERIKMITFFISFTCEREPFKPYGNLFNKSISKNEPYPDTVIFNEENAIRINKVTLLRGKGIVSFYDSITNSEWILIENKK